jgi:hypothetical protein
MTLTKHPHGGALDLPTRRPVQMRRQCFIGPVRAIEATALGTVFHPGQDHRCQWLGHTTRWARRPLDLQPCHTLFMVLLEPQPYRRTMYASILGNHLALPPPMRHQDRLAPVTEASVVGRFEDLFQWRLCCPRQPDPPPRFHPLLYSFAQEGTSKKMQGHPPHV